MVNELDKEKICEQVSEQGELYEMIAKSYEEYHENIAIELANFSITEKMLLSRANKSSKFKNDYLEKYQIHKEAIDDLKKTIPQSTHDEFIREHITDLGLYFRKERQHVRCLEEVKNIRQENNRLMDVIDLFASHEKNLQLCGQELLIQKFTDLDSRGVGDGLVSEWVKFYSKYKNGEKDFIAKLNSKLNSNDNHEKFVIRINNLQRLQNKHKSQIKDFYYTSTVVEISNVKEICSKKEDIILQAIAYLKNQTSNNLVGIWYRGKSISISHSAGIRCERDNDKGNITAFVFYEPNYGEVTFRGDDKDQNLIDFFDKWLIAVGRAMMTNAQAHEYEPLDCIEIILETDSIVSRINLVDDENKNKLPFFAGSVSVTVPKEQMQSKIHNADELNLASQDDTIVFPGMKLSQK